VLGSEFTLKVAHYRGDSAEFFPLLKQICAICAVHTSLTSETAEKKEEPPEKQLF
jgi:hypothetical protein